MEGGERDSIMSAPRDVPIRESAPLSAARPFGRTHEPGWSNAAPDDPRHPAAQIWAGAISRLQTQVSLNTSMLESNRRQIQEVNQRIDGLKQEMGGVAATLHDFRTELRARGPAIPGRHDTGDLDVLISQVEAVTAKANEVDSMKLQLDLMKNRMKRYEDLGAPTALQQRPGTSASSSQKEMPAHEGPSHNSPYPLPHHGPSHHQPLPPMRTASMASPSYSSGSHPPPPSLEPHGRPSYPPPIEPRHFSAESSAMHGSPVSGFRPSESLPPPSALAAGWRSSDSLPHLGGLPSVPLTSAHSRPTTMEPEPHASGWASINAAQPVKRPYEEPRASPYESPGSPKRPKLAPIMPRSIHSDDPYAQSALGPSVTTESSIHGRSRAGSDVSQPQSQVSSVPASTSAPSYRFITSTTQADPHEGWRRENEGRRLGPHGHGHGGPPGHGRRGGRRGGRGGRRARGGGVILGEPRAQQGSPEWEQSEWPGSQVPPNGYHHHQVHPYSPVMGRGGMVRRSGGFAGGRSDREGEPPETPTHGSDEAGAFEAGDGGQLTGSGGKKTRTKPIRNADGVLIRKDGRPDMRSVSSANNLRKVHAKKEAERAEMDSKTPTSTTRSLAPMQAYSEDDENAMLPGTPGTPQEREEGEEEYEDQHRRSHEQSEGQSAPSGNPTERYFPRPNVPEAEMKTERDQNDSQDARGEGSRATTDVEMSEAQAIGQREKDQDTRMATVEESNEQN